MALESNLIGIVHGMMFPGSGNTNALLRGEAKKDYLLNTVQWVIDDPDFEGLEITRVKHLGHRKELIQLINKARNDGKIKEVVYGTFPVQLINEDNRCLPSDISSLDENERIKALDRLKECVDEAFEYKCDKFGFLSGKDPAIMQGLTGAEAETVRQEALNQLRRSVNELCQYIAEGNQQHNANLIPMIKAFDSRTNIPGSSAFKENLIGPADRTEQFCETIRNYYGHKNFGLMVDTSHMIINGEGPDALKRLAPFLGHFHIANAVLNRNNPEGDKRYGDLHPALNVPDSELTSDVLAGYLSALVENNYQGTISFEIKPIGSEIPEDIALSAKQFYIACRNRIDVNYAFSRNYKYITRKFFTDTLWDKLVDLRIQKPNLIKERLQQRKTRDTIAPNGKLVIVAADHPARMVTNVGDEPVAMGDRFEYLGRCARVLMASETDGIMATADVIEDLVLLDHFYQEKSEQSFLDNKVLIACMNRGGLAGARYELLDRMTAYRDAKKLKELKLDGAKMLLRLAVPDPLDRYCLQTMEECSRCVEACNDIDMPVFLEPLPVAQIDGKYKIIMKADELIKVIGVASGLSYSSANIWLKIPYVEEYNRVASAFSGPILMLGGESTGNPIGVIEQFVRGMGEGANVRGAMVGRNVLFPGDDDPAAVAQAVCELVHKDATANESVRALATRRGQQMDLLPTE